MKIFHRTQRTRNVQKNEIYYFSFKQIKYKTHCCTPGTNIILYIGQLYLDLKTLNSKHGPLEKTMVNHFTIENPMKSMERQKQLTLKDELPRSVDAQYATGEYLTPERRKRWSQSKINTQLWM